MENANKAKKETQLEEIARRRGFVDGRGALINIPLQELSRKEFHVIGYYDKQSNMISYVVYGAPKEEIRTMDFGAGFASQKAQYASESCSPRTAFNSLFVERPKKLNSDNAGQ